MGEEERQKALEKQVNNPAKFVSLGKTFQEIGMLTQNKEFVEKGVELEKRDITGEKSKSKKRKFQPAKEDQPQKQLKK